MSKIAKGLATVAGIAAAGLSLLTPAGPIFLGLTSTQLASGLGAGAGLLTAAANAFAKPPISTPPLEDITIGAEQPYPYAIGRCKLTGHMVHTEAHGRERQDVPNPWRTDTYVLTGAGPVEAIDQLLVNGNALSFNPSQAGQAPGFYGKYLRGTSQVGTIPEGEIDTFGNDAAPPSFTYWNSSRRISGMAAMQFSALVDDKETHFRNGMPNFAAVGRWAKAYDARLDSTVEGGSGSHRLGDETTYTYHNNPAMHALTYAFGRYQNDKLVCGGGLPVTTLDVASFIEAANVQDANGWTVNGVVYENGEDGELWNNLKQILEAGGAFPTNDGGVLRCMQMAPRVVLDTVTDDDLEGPCSTPGMTPWEAGINEMTPRFVSEANQWTLVSTDPVSVPALLTAQGEARTKSRDWALVTDADQVSALAAYAIYDTVELQPIVLTVGRRFIAFDVGDALTLDLPSMGLDHTAVIQKHSVDLATGKVTLTLVTDTADKHTFALSRESSGPPHPTLVAEGDIEKARDFTQNAGLRPQAIATSYPKGLDTTPITVEADGDDWVITVPEHTRVYPDPDRFPAVTVNESTVTVTGDATVYYLAYDDELMAGGDITLLAFTDPLLAVTTDEELNRHHVGYIRTAADETGVPARPPTEVPPRVPAADNVGGFTANEIAEQLARTTKEQLAEIVGDTVLENGTDLININDLIKAIAIRRREDAARNGNENFDLGFTGWVSDTGGYLDAWPASVESGSLVLTDGTPVTAEDTPYEQEQGAEFARLIRGRAST